jgi:hypothetical protein
MSVRMGRKRRRPDENVRPYRPVDGNSAISARLAGRKQRLARACALCGAIACGLVAPAVARAADPFGTAQIAAEVNAAVAQATAVTPQAAVAAAVAPVDAAKTSNAASVDTAKTLDAATKSLDIATKQAAAVASSAAAEAQRATQSAVVASVPAVSGRAAPPVKAHRPTNGHRKRAAGRSPAPRSWLRPRSRPFVATGGATSLLISPSAAPAGRPQNSGAPASRATPKPIRPSVPHRPPPEPLPPQPGSALAGQAGGNGPLTPLVVGALAAVLLMMTFEFLPRALPPKAFRKPRLIALLPWHPG